MKSSGDEWMRRYFLNTYLTLITKAINFTYVYAVDDSLQTYLN